MDRLKTQVEWLLSEREEWSAVGSCLRRTALGQAYQVSVLGPEASALNKVHRYTFKGNRQPTPLLSQH